MSTDFPFSRLQQGAHGRRDLSAEDTHSSMVPDTTSFFLRKFYADFGDTIVDT